MDILSISRTIFAPFDFGVTLVVTFAAFPDPFGSKLIVSADPFKAVDQFGSKALPATTFAAADAQKAK